MAYSKYYTRINWKNRPSTSTPLGETNLNHMDSAVNELDNRIVNLDATKFNVSSAQNLCSGIDYDTGTGVFVFHYVNGATKRVDLNIEKIPVSMALSAAGVLTITNTDGTKYTANVASLLVTVNFVDSTEIDFQVTDSGKTRTVTAVIKNGSITESKLDPSIQAGIRNDRLLAQTAAGDAQTHANDAKRYAVGGVIAADAQDNAKYYCQEAGKSAAAAASSQTAAKASETAAKASQTAAKTSETAAKSSQTAAAASQTAAHTSEINAKASESAAATSQAAAKASENAAKSSQTAAKASETAASGSQTAAAASAGAASASAAESRSWAEKAESVTDISIASSAKAGIVKPNPDEIQVADDGTMSMNMSFTEPPSLTAVTGTDNKKTFFGKLAKAVKSLIDHLANKSNPHGVTKAQVGLGNCNNTADSAKSVASATKATQDSAGQQINTTYIKSLSIAGRTITIMKGNGATSTLTTQDTVTALINNLLTTEAGKGALDAAMGKYLSDQINTLNGKTMHFAAASGTSIALPDTVPGGLMLDKVYGLFRQNNYTGRNLYNRGDYSGSGHVVKTISLPAGSYTVMLDIDSADTDAETCLIEFFSIPGDYSGLVAQGYVGRGTRKTKTFTFGEAVTEIRIWASINHGTSAGDAFTISNIMIVAGSYTADTIGDYEPYTGGEASPSPLYPQDMLCADNPVISCADSDGNAGVAVTVPCTLRALPTHAPYANLTTKDAGGTYYWIADAVEITDGVPELIQRIGVKTYDGTETWVKHPATNDDYLVTYNANIKTMHTGYRDYSKSNYFKIRNTVSVQGNGIGIYADNTQPGSPHITIAKSVIGGGGGVEEWKAWLAARAAEEKPFTLWYPLKEPVRERITDVDVINGILSLRTYNGQTVIDSPVWLEATYGRDRTGADIIQNRLMCGTMNKLIITVRGYYSVYANKGEKRGFSEANVHRTGYTLISVNILNKNPMLNVQVSDTDDYGVYFAFYNGGPAATSAEIIVDYMFIKSEAYNLLPFNEFGEV